MNNVTSASTVIILTQFARDIFNNIIDCYTFLPRRDVSHDSCPSLATELFYTDLYEKAEGDLNQIPSVVQ